MGRTIVPRNLGIYCDQTPSLKLHKRRLSADKQGLSGATPATQSRAFSLRFGAQALSHERLQIDQLQIPCGHSRPLGLLMPKKLLGFVPGPQGQWVGNGAAVDARADAEA
jgi:hypothetical protein